MKPILTFPLSCIAALTVTLLAAKAAETPINELLRDALYLEEVSRDTEGAAKQYMEVVSRYEAQRDQAATALFRLAEVRRKQGRKDEAITLYQKLITEFPNTGTQVDLAKENLASLGGKAPAGMQEAAPDPETKFIAEYEQLRKTSPDVANRPIYLSLGVTNNHLRVVKYLLEKGTDPNSRFEKGGSNGSHTALSLSASQGNLALCELLLDAGAKTETPGALNPLSQAVFKGYPKIVELLLRRGAKPNVDSEPSDSSYEGTPLTIAARYAHGDILDQLLKAGADPNLVMPPDTGITPLHFAILYDNEANAKKLIEAGARTDLPAKEERKIGITMSSPSNRMISIGATPLITCAANGSRGLLELMAANATKEDLSTLLPYTTGAWEKFRWLLDKGANPNVRSSRGVPLLILAIDRSDLVQELLDFGADPNITYFDEGKSPSEAEPFTPLRAAARLTGEASIETTIMLIKAGAKPDEAWLKKLIDGTDDSRITSRKLLFEHFVIPAIAQREAITLAITHPDIIIKPVEIATPESSSPPEDLATLLIQPKNPIGWFKTQPNGTSVWPEMITVWRMTEGTTKVFWSGRVTESERFPPLQWGDVIQFSFDAPKRKPASTELGGSPTNYEYADKLPFALHWALRKRISFPVQIDADGETRTYQMRGDRVAFDPTRPELPLLESNRLAALLCPGTINVDIVITRDGSPELRTNSINSNGSVTLKTNDKVRLIRINNKEDASPEEKRKKRIEVKAMGSAIFRSYAGADEMAPPTLVQMLADLLGYSSPEREVPEASAVVEWLLNTNYSARSLWINPDLSDIRIRRLEDDGSDKIIRINLAEKIAVYTESTPTADVLASDVALKRGDIVEISLKGDPDGSWHGLSAKEAGFFAKILNCRVQVTDKDRKVSVKHLTYRPLAYVSTDGGKLPVRPPNYNETDVSGVTPYAAFGYRQPTVTRNGVSYAGESGRWLFLREGDQVSSNEDIIHPRRPEITPSTPRPRVIPGTPSSGTVPVTPRVIPSPPSR